MIIERNKLIRAAVAWTEEKSFANFMQLWQIDFGTEDPFFKLWYIFRNTVNGRYHEIAEKQFRAWQFRF